MCLPMSKYYRISGKMEFTFFFKFNKLGLSRKRERLTIDSSDQQTLQMECFRTSFYEFFFEIKDRFEYH